MTPERMLVVWCPDWPVVAAGVGLDVAAAVVHANRVVVCSPAARADGVRRGMRRRAAQACCPTLAVLAPDPARDARAFEPVVAAVERAVTPRVEVVRPGVCALGTRGPSRYFGGDEALAAHVAATVAAAGTGCRVGVADGLFAASLAARGVREGSPHPRGLVVPPGQTPAFLAPLPVDVLDAPDLVDLLHRLGVHALGDLAALPVGAVTDRFGPDGALAHRRARGLEERPLLARTPPPDLTVEMALDPPVAQVEVAAFAARALAGELAQRLARQALACRRLGIEVETEHAERFARRWRTEGAFTEAAFTQAAFTQAVVAERVRWQLDGWLAGSAAAAPTGALTLLRLVPEELVGAGEGQLRLWGAPAGQPQRVARALAHVQGLLGTDAVVTAVLRGGVDPADRVGLVAWDGAAPQQPVVEGPWPGRLPSPAPATTFPTPLAAQVTGADGTPVGVSGRRAASAAPAFLAVAGRPAQPVSAWAGPWVDDDWAWDPATRRRRARFQVATADGTAWLLAVADGQWTAEARYD